MSTRKKLLFGVLMSTVLTLMTSLSVYARQIEGYGSYDLFINIDASPYSDAWDSRWGDPYGIGGCTWFAEARVEELTGQNYAGIIYGVDQWWNTIADRSGFSKTTTLSRTNKSLVCWSSPHIAVVEGFTSSGEIIVSEGGYTGGNYDNGYCRIKTVSSEAALKSSNSGFMGFITLPVAAIGATGTLDVNGLLDGTNSGNLGSYGTCDVYINGSLVADDVADYCTAWAAGTTYRIEDIKAKDGYSFDGYAAGAQSGTIASGVTTDVRLIFNTCKLDVNGLLDGKASGTLGSYGTFDIYVNGTLLGDDVNDFSQKLTKGSTYEIKDIKTGLEYTENDVTYRYTYEGVSSGSLTGTIGSGTKTVSLKFTTHTYVEPTGDWKEMDFLPGNITSEECEIQYKHTYMKTAASSPGSGWTKVEGSGVTTYQNSGAVQEYYIPRATSNTYVLVGSYYYHYCDPSSGRINYVYGGSYTQYHGPNAIDSFDVAQEIGDDDDSNIRVYQLTWKSGAPYSGLATCAGGTSAWWYRMYQYQPRTAVTTYTWTKETDWQETKDFLASSVRYRFRLKDTENPVINSVEVTDVSPRSYTVTVNASDDKGIAKVIFYSWSASETESNATVKEIIPDSVKPGSEVSTVVPISEHGNELDAWYYTKVVVYDPVGHTAEYEKDDVCAYIPVFSRSSKKLNLPADLTEIEESAFEGDIGFGEAILPEGVTTIGSRAFADCSRLLVVYLPDSVADIAVDTFTGSSNVVLLCESNNAAAAYAREQGIPYLTEP